MAKEEYGQPTGGGPGNATTKWIRSKKEWGFDVYKTGKSGSHTIAIAMVANFLFYAPIESADLILPSCALAYASVETP